MKSLLFFTITSTLIFTLQTTFSQSNDKLIKIDGKEINLEKVDVDKGMVIIDSSGYEKIEFNGFDSIYFRFKKLLYRSPDNYTYLINNEKELGESYQSQIYYCEFGGDTIFTKKVDFSIQPFITHTGNYILLDIGSEDSSALLIMDKKGNIIKQIANWSWTWGVQTANLHQTILIDIHGYPEKTSKFLFINDDDGITKELDFSNFTGIQTLTRNEKYFVFANRDSIIVYNNNGKFLWSIPNYPKSTVCLYNNGKKYLQEFKDTITDSMVLAIKNSRSHEIIKEIRSISYNNHQYPVYKFGFTDDDCSAIYISSYFNWMEYFNFFTPEGAFINDAAIPAKDTRKYSIIKNNGKYEVLQDAIEE